jgi:hypothetical protein
MSTNDTARRSWHQWVIPGVAVAAGIAYLIAGIVGDEVGFGLFGLGLMTAVALVLILVRRRSETVQGLMDRGDERIVMIDLRSTAFAGTIVIVAVLAAMLVQIARGEDGSPYAQIAALGGVSYIASVVWLRLRG